MSARVYYYNEALSRTTSNTTDYSQTKCTLTFQPSASKTYAIFWRVLQDGSTLWYASMARLYNVTAGSALADAAHECHETTTRKFVVGGVAVWTAAASPPSQTFAIQTANVSGTTTGTCEGSLLIIELIDSVDQWASSLGSTASSSTTYIDKASLSWTPGSAGDYLVFAYGEADVGSGYCRFRINVNSGTYASVHEDHNVPGAADWNPYIGAARMVNASGAQTAVLNFSSNGAQSTTIRNAHIVALRMDRFDFKYWGEDLTQHDSTSSSYADGLSITDTPEAGDYALLGVATVFDSGASTVGTGMKAMVAGAAIETVFPAVQPANIATQRVSWFLPRKITATAASTTWKQQYARAFGASGTASVDDAYLAILQLISTNTTAAAIAPDAVAASTNLGGTVADIDDDPDSADANWMAATSATAVTDIRVSFPTPAGSPYGPQNFKYWLRKTTGTPTPTITAELRESNTLRKTITAAGTGVTSTSGQLFTGTWSADDLVTAADGSAVECRIVSVVGKAPAPGTAPAYSSAGAAVVDATITTTVQPAKPATVNAGDLLVLQVLARNTNNDGAGPASVTGFTPFAGNTYGANGANQALYWRIAGAGEATQTVNVTCTGGTTADLVMARIYRFTAADGFASTPIEAVNSTSGTTTSLGAPTITPLGANRRLVCFGAIGSSDAAIGSMTGESGGADANWTEAVTGNTTTGGDGTLNVQTSPCANGDAITGGAIAYTVSTGQFWTSVGCALVPADLGTGAATNTVDVGAIEWNAVYRTPSGEAETGMMGIFGERLGIFGGAVVR